MKRKQALAAELLIALIILVSCAPSTQQQVVGTKESQVKLRAIQTRAFDTTEKEKMLRTVIATLQDLGFVIDKADSTLGTVSATKLGRYPLQMMVSVRPLGRTQLLVRANVQYNLYAVEDPEPYQQFFDSLSKAIFLHATPQPLKKVEKPKSTLDEFLEKIKKQEKVKKRAKDLLVRKFKQLLEDLEKYKKIKSSDLDSETKLAAWVVLISNYPIWSDGVEPGDSDTLVINALSDDIDGLLLTVLEKQNKKVSQRLASIPKKVTDAKIYKVKLRDIPKKLMQPDIKKMIEKHNFFEKDLHDWGGFPNELVDNADETITDRVTGLMWEKGGSSRILHFSKAKKYVSRLNREMFAGYNDWRIPTLEELCSLLEQKVNERGQYIGSPFNDKQSKCLSADRFVGGHYQDICVPNNIVNFSKGKIDEIATEDPIAPYCQSTYSMYYYIRAVRTIK